MPDDGPETALRESEASYRLLIDSWAQAMWETDPQGVVVKDSPSWRACTGQTLDEWLGYGWLDAVHPDDRAYAERQWRDAVAAGTLADAEFRLCSPAGDWRWTNVRAVPVRDDAGRIEKWAGINIDIDARKRAEAALRESEVKYRSLFEAIDEGFCDIEMLFDAGGAPADYRFLEINPAFERQTGLAGALGKRMRELAPDHEEHWFEIYGRVARTRQPEQFERRAEALGRWFKVDAFPVGAPGDARVGLLFDDITGRKRADATLRESEERQVFLLKLSDALRPLGDAADIQTAAARLLAEHLGVMRVQYLWPAEDSGDTLIAGAGFTTGAPLVGGIVRFASFGAFLKAQSLSGETRVEADITRDPRIGPTQLKAYEELGIRAYVGVWLVKSGKLAAVLAVHEARPRQWAAHEVALIEEVAERTWAAVERARVEAALRESEERRELALEATQLGTFVWHVREDRGEPDARMLALFDQPPDGGLNLRDALATMIHPDDGARYAAAVAEASRPGGSRKLQTDIRVRRADGSWRWLEISARVSFGPDGQPTRMAGTALDITDRKAAEISQRESEQHQAILLAELQHRVRNIMALIRSVARRTAETVATPEDYALHLEGRINAMARTQAMLTRDVGKGVDLHELLLDELQAQAAPPSSHTYAGPDVALPPKAAEILTLAVHELATNAVKYGALSQADGRIDISWQVERSGDGPPWLRLQWREHGVVLDAAPRREGFGTELVTRRVPYELRGEGSMTFGDTGIAVVIRFPLLPAASIFEVSELAKGKAP